MGDNFTDGIDRWNIPDDRQLALRGRLETGWSSYRGNNFLRNVSDLSLNEEEQEYVLSVLQRKERIQMQEQARVGKLVKKLDHMRNNILGDGVTTCLICGTKAGLLKDSLHFCGSCGKMVCAKCSIEMKPPSDGYGKYYLCVLCNENKMLWKRSGAWFYNTMPKYTIQEESNNNLNDNNYNSMNNGRMNSIHRPYGTIRSGSFMDLQSQDSIDEEGSDDSDIDIGQAKAFEIPEEKRSIAHYYINTDEDSRSLISVSPDINMKRGSIETNPSITFSHVDKIDSPRSLNQENNMFTTQQSINSTSSRGRNSMDGASSSNSSPRLGTSGVFQRMSTRDDSHSHSNGTNNNKMNNNAKSNGSHGKSSCTNSNGSINSEQDIDQMFQSYDQEKEEKEYHGQFGMIKFTVQYDPNTQELLIIIGSCKGLKSGEKGNIPNPYVKTVILPISPDAAKASKKRTPTIKKANDPVFNFSMVYPGISEVDIESKGIKLSVMDETNFGNNITIGETCIPLKGLGNRPVQQFRRILDVRANDEALFLDTKKAESNPGRIELALHYLSKQEKLVVGIIRCVGLKALDPNGYSDPYVKCYLLPDPNKKTKRKTSVKKKTLNPEFNHEIQYDIPRDELAKRTLYVSVWDHDVGRSNDFIGGITLGIDSTGEVLRHWFDTLKTADRRLIRWHNLSESCPIIE